MCVDHTSLCNKRVLQQTQFISRLLYVRPKCHKPVNALITAQEITASDHPLLQDLMQVKLHMQMIQVNNYNTILFDTVINYNSDKFYLAVSDHPVKVFICNT
jgi:hypothetical protein